MSKCSECRNFVITDWDCKKHEVCTGEIQSIILLLERVYPLDYSLSDDDLKTSEIIKKAIKRILELNCLEVNETNLNELIKFKRKIESWPAGHDEISDWIEIVSFFKCKLFYKKEMI